MAMARGLYTRSPMLQEGRSKFALPESEYSCSTSWEFTSVPMTPTSNTIPEESEITHFSSPLSSSTPVGSFSLRMSALGSPEYLRGDGSRNSTGSHSSSSTGSQKSHDSGFLDSMETRRRHGNSGSTQLAVSLDTTPVKHHLTPSLGGRQECPSCIYQEVILARSEPGKISPFPIVDTNLVPSVGIFGTPACSSTPLKSAPLNRVLQIDNFESLNKNLKSLDTNNNRRKELGDKVWPSGSRNQSVKPSERITGSRSVSEFNRQPVVIPPLRQQTSAPSLRTDGNGRVDLNISGVSSSQHSRGERKEGIPKWLPLPRGFKRIPGTSFNASDDIVIKSHLDNEALRLWLHELKSHVEPDCLYLLQTKSVNARRKNGKGQVSAKPISTPLISIRHVERVASLISEEYSYLCKHLRSGGFGSVPTLVSDLLVSIEDFLKDLQEIHGNLEKSESRLAHATYMLRLSLIAFGNEQEKIKVPRKGHQPRTLEDCQLYLESPCGSREELESPFTPTEDSRSTGRLAEKQRIIMEEIGKGVMRIGSLFTEVTNQRLRNDLNAILHFIGNGGLLSFVSLQVLATILYEGGSHMCKLAASIRTVRTLLRELIDNQDESIRFLCLRCLATILSVGEAVNDFDKAGGFEVIADILVDPTTTLQLKYEGVGVLTQATDPWIDLESNLTSLGRHLDKIIYALTRLIPHARCDEENFLLTVAAISNLTFLELTSMEYLRIFQTVPLITSALVDKSDFSLFVLDHVSTIFANMAGIESCRTEIVEHGGVQLLTHFLHSSTLGLNSLPEVTACERLQQKSTIAISRLANEDGVAAMVLEGGGIHRLVQLSRNDRERNYSDGVLIASLATLRKLVSICGGEVIKELEAEELIHPRLLDSFLLFSSRQESYV